MTERHLVARTISDVPYLRPVPEADHVAQRRADESLIVDLEGYEGPLDLLLTLARVQKVDLMKISVLHLAEQYLAFVEQARALRIELAADYLVMAAWLAFLKSRLLLPPDAQAEDGSWPVQVALSQEAAEALDLEVGDSVPARDEQGRPALVRISGTFVAADEDDEAWQVATRVLHPTSGTSEGVRRTSATALVSAESLPDLRFALSGDAVSHRVVFAPDPKVVRRAKYTVGD